MSVVLFKYWEWKRGEDDSLPEPPKGVWFGGKQGPKSVLITCCECGLTAGINHDIADDGTVTPSLVCPYTPCTMHVFGKLENWPRVD